MYKEFYGEPPFHHHHHMGPMEHEHIANAAAYARLNTKLSVHMNDDSRHITDEEREKWNEAAESGVDNLDELLANKADTSDIPTKVSQLENDANYISKSQLDNALGELDQLYMPWGGSIDDSKYATKNDLGAYIKKSQALFSYGGADIFVGDSISIPQGGSDYTLPAASTTTLGGIKLATSISGNNNYPVKLNSNNEAYVTVPTSGGGGSQTIVEYKPTYSIQVLSSTMRKYTDNGEDKVQGDIYFQVLKHGETTEVVPRANLDGAICEIYLNNERVVYMIDSNGTSVGDISYNTETKTHNFALNSNSIACDAEQQSTNNLYSKIGSYINIRLYKTEGQSETLAASVVVPVRVDGKDGQSGSGGTQSLEYPVIRMRDWVASPTIPYNDGTVVEDGVMYKDVVRYKNGQKDYGYFYCKTSGTTATPIDNNQQVSQDWEPITMSGAAAFDLLLANSAYIQSLTAKQIVVTDTNNTPVGGMLSGNSIPTELGQTTNNDGIRIFAGPITNGDVSTAPFTVDSNGHVKANDIELKGTIDADVLYTSYKIYTATSTDFDNGYITLADSDMAQKIVLAYETNVNSDGNTVPSNKKTMTVNLPSADNYAGQEIEIIFPSGYQDAGLSSVEYVPATVIQSGTDGLRSPLCTSVNEHSYHIPVQSVSSSSTWVDNSKWMVSRVRLLSIPETTYKEPEWGGNETNYYWLILDSTNLIYNFQQ